MKYELSVSVAVGAMKLIADGTGSADFNSFGLGEQDYELFTGDKTWNKMDQPIIERCLTVVTYGLQDVIGVPRFAVSAEYTSAIIAMLVHPANQMTACSWAQSAAPNAALANGAPELGRETATPDQLFGLLSQLMEHNPNEFKQRFEKRTGIVETEE